MTRDKTKGVYFVLAFVALFFFQQFTSVISGFIANLFNYNYLDPDNIFMYISIHHIVQMVIALITIYLITTKFKVDFNLKFILSKPGVIYTLVFIVIMWIYTLITYFIGYSVRTIQPYAYSLTPMNVYGTLGFQTFLSGPSEEILFRALPVTIFLYLFKSNVKNRENIIVVLLSSVLFSLAHISWDFNSFTFV